MPGGQPYDSPPKKDQLLRQGAEQYWRRSLIVTPSQHSCRQGEMALLYEAVDLKAIFA